MTDSAATDAATDAATQAARCARCGAPFTCGAHDRSQPCWCAQLPPLAPQPGLPGCLCLVCLQAALAAQIAAPR